MLLLINNLGVPPAYVPDKPHEENMVQQVITPCESYRQKSCESETMNPILPMTLKTQRGQGTFQRLHSMKEPKGRHDQTVPDFLQS